MGGSRGFSLRMEWKCRVRMRVRMLRRMVVVGVRFQEEGVKLRRAILFNVEV